MINLNKYDDRGWKYRIKYNRRLMKKKSMTSYPNSDNVSEYIKKK